MAKLVLDQALHSFIPGHVANPAGATVKTRRSRLGPTGEAFAETGKTLHLRRALHRVELSAAERFYESMPQRDQRLVEIP